MAPAETNASFMNFLRPSVVSDISPPWSCTVSQVSFRQFLCGISIERPNDWLSVTAITHTAGAASSSGADDGVKQTTTPAEATSSREIEGVGTVGGEEAGHGVTAKVRVDLVASTWTRSLWRTVPSRILMARGSWTRRWMARFRGRAP